MIVGIRTLGWKWRRQSFAGGRLRWGYFFEVFRHELHPTKGWRLIGRKRTAVSEHLWRKAPLTEERFERGHHRQQADPARLMLDRPSSARKLQRWHRSGMMTLQEPEDRARMRHSFYRREKERQARTAAAEAWRESSPTAPVAVGE